MNAFPTEVLMFHRHLPAAASLAPPIALTALFALSGCENDVAPPAPLDASLVKGHAEKPEVWTSSDSPTLFSSSLEMGLAALPQNGEAQLIPWPSSYWPTYEDSINHKWDGASSESPSAKYGRAFNVAGVEDAVSAFRGIDSASSRTKCTTANASEKCKSDIGEACAIREGKTEGYCVPTWFGICHAWAPAAILIPEPQHAVEQNGVTFKVNDLKALATLVHDGVVNKFVSLRCEKDHRPGADEAVDVDTDEYGRPTDRACRDSNAGSFHVLITNYLGLMKQSFVFDRTFDDEVWNQPLRGYSVVESRELSVAEANQALGVTRVGGTTSNLSANVAQGSWKHFDAIAVTAGSNVSVRMSGSGDGDLFVNFGAQPTSSAYACRPYQGGSDETCELTVPAGQTQLFVSVNGYSAANVQVAVTSGGTLPTGYVFNANAKKLVYMKTDVKYIVESSASLDGNLSAQVGQYTQTDRYEYVLELDAQDKIVGGEWVGTSKTFHPDFAWLPVRVRNTAVASGKISYANVKALLDRSIEANEGGGGSPTEKHVVESGTVAKNAFVHYGPFRVAAGSTLTAQLSGTNDADLYVRKGAAPTTQSYDCRPYKNGSEESCAVTGPGDIYVAVVGYAATSDFSLDVRYVEGGGVTPPPPPPTPTTHLNVSGSVALNEMKVFSIAVTAQKPIMIRTTGPNDIDLFVQMNAAPTTSSYLAQAYTASGNETLRFVPSSSGTLQIGVHGYQASSFTLTTADE